MRTGMASRYSAIPTPFLCGYQGSGGKGNTQQGTRDARASCIQLFSSGILHAKRRKTKTDNFGSRKGEDKLKNAWIGVLLLSGISLTAEASNWVLVTRHDDIRIYLDVERVSKRGSLRTAWDRTDYPSSLTMAFTPFKEYRSMQALGYYDCAKKTGALRELFLYSGASGSGEAVGHVSIPEDHLDFKAMAPGSVGETLLNYVCRPQFDNQR